LDSTWRLPRVAQSGHLSVRTAPRCSLEPIVPVGPPPTQEGHRRRPEVDHQEERSEPLPLPNVLAFVGQDLDRDPLSREDVATHGLGPDRHEMYSEPAPDTRILDQDSPDVSGLDLPGWGGDGRSRA